MRITACAVSALLLTGCSWYGGNSHQSTYGQGYGAQGHGAYQTQGLRGYSQYGHQQASYGHSNPCMQPVAVQTVTTECTTHGHGGAYGATSGYSGGSSYGTGTGYAPVYGGSSYGTGTGYSQSQTYTGSSYGTGTGYSGSSYGTGTGYSGGSYGTGTGYSGGATQHCGQAGYAQQGCYGYGYGQSSYNQGGYYQAPSLRPRASYGAGSPFGFEFGIGTEFDVAGNFKRDIERKFATNPGAFDPDFTPAFDDIEYGDVFDPAVKYQVAGTYALDKQTALLGQVGYSKAEANRVLFGTLDDGMGFTEDLFIDTGDLEQFTVEGGLRRYMGGFRPGHGASAIVPYVGGTIGAVHTGEVQTIQSSATRYVEDDGMGNDTRIIQTLYEDGWSPTASALVGAEWRVANQVALGVETGLRYTGALDGPDGASDDRWTVPLTLRGRLAF